MKKHLLILTLIFCSSLAGFSQKWTCDKLSEDMNYFNKGDTGNNKKWAENIKSHFPLNSDNELDDSYVLQCSDSIPRMEIVALTEGWLGTVFSNAKEQISVSNENQIICQGSLGQVAFEQKYIGATRIIAPLEIKVLFKDNRVRLTLLTKNYSMAYANVGQLESGVLNMGLTFPFSNSSKHKSAYAMAYINTLSKHLNLALSYLQYLNLHTSDTDKDAIEW